MTLVICGLISIYSKSSIDDGRDIFFSELHSVKAPSPISITDDGIAISDNDEQTRNLQLLPKKKDFRK